MLSPLTLLAIEENEEVRLASLRSKFDALYEGQEDNYDCGFKMCRNLPCPSEERIESFKNRSYSLDSLGSLETSSSRVTHKNQINWSSIDDCIRHWGVLSKDDQHAIRCLVLSDTVTNSNRYGVKKRNLESHLLLHIGVDMTNIVNNGYDSVLTNLMHPETRRYSGFCLDDRTVDPKTCRVAHYKFKKTYSTEALFKAGYIAYQCVITSDESYRAVADDPSEAKKKYQEFFKSTNKELSRLSHKRGLIDSYIYSNEISVDSILEGKYRPHTHVMFFIPREKSSDLSEAAALEIETVFNSRFNDRKMSLKKIERDEEEVPKVMKTNEECDKSIGYFYRAYSLADQYAREVREDNIELLNNKTRECYRTLVWLFKPSDDQKSFRHVAHSNIPKHGETVSVRLLQKKKKSNTIKKAVSTELPSENFQTMNKKDQIVKSAIFGMKRRKAENQALQGFRDPQGNIDPMARNTYRSMQGDPGARGLSSNQLAEMTGNVLNDHKQYMGQLESQQQQEAEQPISAHRNNMSSGSRYTYQPKPAAPVPAQRGALSATERANDSIVQNQIAQNVQRSSAPINPTPATATQMASANSGRAHHTVDQNGAIRYAPAGQNVAASTPAPAAQPQAAQPQQNPYQQAQQSAMQQYPELAQAGSPTNKAFLNLVNQNGGSAALQKNPGLISQYAQQAQTQLTQGNKSSPAPMAAQGTPRGARPVENPQVGDKNFAGPRLPVEKEIDQMYAARDEDAMKYNTANRPAGKAPGVDDYDFVGPRPNANIRNQMLVDQEDADDAAFAASQKANKPPAAPAPTQANNTQAQNPLLNTPAASNNFAGNVSLGLGGASQAPKAPTPGQPVAATNTGAPTKQGSMLSEFKTKTLEKSAEADYLSHLREELLKEANLVYSKEEVIEFTESRESFEKAAELEAQLVWGGLLDELKKEGASEDFIEGFTKEAAGIGNLWKGIRNFGTNHVMPAAKWVGNRFKIPSVKDALIGGTTGATVGGLTLGPVGAAVGGLGGAAVGGLGAGGATALTGAGLYGMGAFGSNKKKLDPYGAPEDRHRVVPFMKNKYTGAAGGALLAHAIARENGIEGPMGWLLPIIGGMVGHKYFPDMMNKWKDPRGYGVNSLGSGAAMIQQPQNVCGG